MPEYVPKMDSPEMIARLVRMTADARDSFRPLRPRMAPQITWTVQRTEEQIQEAWYSEMMQERDVIWQRELIAWHLWHQERKPKQDGIADLKQFLGTSGYPVEDFTAEGGLSKWRERFAKAWIGQVREAKKEDDKYRYCYYAWHREASREEEALRRACDCIRFQVRKMPPITADGYFAESHIHVQIRDTPDPIGPTRYQM